MLSLHVIAWLMLSPLAAVQAPPAKQEPVEALVKKLASQSFRERELASLQLSQRLGAAAALKEAVRSPDPEVSNRATQILKKLDPLLVARLQSLLEAGAVDQATELLARWPKGKQEKACWEATCKFLSQLAKQHEKQCGEIIDGKILGIGFGNFVRLIELKQQHRIERIKNGQRVPPIEVFFNRSEKEVLKDLVGRVTVASGDITIMHRLNAFVIASGSIKVESAYAAIIVSDKDVTVMGSQNATMNCLIIARGNVICRGHFIECHIISGQSVDRKDAKMFRCKVVENEPKPLGFIQFFDPAQEGITVAQAKAGVRITKLIAGKPFQQAGLREGDLITNINEAATPSPEVFRRLLRRHIAWEEDMTLRLQRDGKEMHIQVQPVRGS